jgi:hypothetical protein
VVVVVSVTGQIRSWGGVCGSSLIFFGIFLCQQRLSGPPPFELGMVCGHHCAVVLRSFDTFFECSHEKKKIFVFSCLFNSPKRRGRRMRAASAAWATAAVAACALLGCLVVLASSGLRRLIFFLFYVLRCCWMQLDFLLRRMRDRQRHQLTHEAP